MTTVATATTGTPTTPQSSSPYTIIILDYQYNPATLTVPAGTTVEWINQDADDHTATSYAGSPASFDLTVNGDGGSAQFTFTLPGTYNYHCLFHAEMFGTIIVV